MKEEIHITFLRHGRSRADDEEVHEGRYDSPLTDIGRSQVQARAQDFLSRNLQFDKIITSPLQRAYETAKIIGQWLNVSIEEDSDWMEMDNGPLAGLPREIAEKKYPRPSFRNPYEPFCGTGESDWDIYCRGAKAVEKIIRRGIGNYLVVAHGGILNAAMRTIVGAQPHINQQGIFFKFDDTGFARMVYRPSEHLWRLLEFYVC
ncbi:MAG: histidine phosphatase family protein [Chloroflexi bacterium HGW-Chloroflexi-5]|jgi:2,3-bisphosphoglycerate-dependent phosphoglycerate mutase|nr:MAG: histidine phosphatase family protein [Chloroflexi bacterium HGW-Chloroflexi-5]